MPTNLITTAQAQALLPALAGAELAALPGLIGPASRAVEKWCKRSLGYGSYIEFHRPELSRKIYLRNPPVLAGTVELRDQFAAVASITNVNPAITRSTVSLAGASMVLTSYGSGAPGPTTLTLASYVTLANLQTAVNAIGGGWSMVVNPTYPSWLTADLEPNPGAMGATGVQCMLYSYVHDVAEWAMDSTEQGTIELTQSQPQAFRYPDRMWGGFGPGLAYAFFNPNARFADVRCDYQAGYDPLGVAAPVTPDDLQMGTALVIKGAIDSGQYSGVLASENLGNTSYAVGKPMAIPPAAMGWLSSYVLRRIN